MTEIERLIQQAKRVKVKIPKTKSPAPSDKTWQEILDGAPYPQLRYGKL